MTRRKVAILGLCVLTGAAIGQAVAPEAHADSHSYLQAVAAQDVPITAYTLSIGDYVCRAMRDNGTDGIDQQVGMAQRAGVSSHDTAVLVVEAAYELCPSQLGTLDLWLHSDSRLTT